MAGIVNFPKKKKGGEPPGLKHSIVRAEAMKWLAEHFPPSATSSTVRAVAQLSFENGWHEAVKFLSQFLADTFEEFPPNDAV